MKKWITIVMAVLAVVLLPACSEESDSGGSGSGNETSVTLTGRMSAADQAAADQNSTTVRAIATAVTLSDYTLYCVTFTDPPLSGTGIFDADGLFSVTIEDAAGLSIGCFITDATGASVATVTFETGTESDASMAMEGGEHTITIIFDSETGTATADVSQVTEADTSAVLDADPAVMAGAWNLACQDGDPHCDFGDPDQPVTNIDVYFNIISGTDNVTSDTVYNMGVWPAEAEYLECGGTEQLNFVKNASNLVQTGATTSPTLSFKHFYSDNAGKFRPFTFGDIFVTADAMAAISGADLLAWMNSLEISLSNAAYAYPDADWRSPWQDASDTWSCPGKANLDGPFQTLADPFTDLQVRQCVINWFQLLAEHGPVVPVSTGTVEQAPNTGPVPCTPRIGGHIWNSPYLRWYDANEPNPPTFTGASAIPIGKPHGPADIGSRFALMPLEVEGDTAVAFDRWEDTWTEWFEDPATPGTSTSKVCHKGNEMQIAFIPNATDSTKAKAFFTVNEWSWCDGDTPANGYKSFEVDMTKLP